MRKTRRYKKKEFRKKSRKRTSRSKKYNKRRSKKKAGGGLIATSEVPDKKLLRIDLNNVGVGEVYWVEALKPDSNKPRGYKTLHAIYEPSAKYLHVITARKNSDERDEDLYSISNLTENDSKLIPLMKIVRRLFDNYNEYFKQGMTINISIKDQNSIKTSELIDTRLLARSSRYIGWNGGVKWQHFENEFQDGENIVNDLFFDSVQQAINYVNELIESINRVLHYNSPKYH